jgi:hypothetical protein
MAGFVVIKVCMLMVGKLVELNSLMGVHWPSSFTNQRPGSQPSSYKPRWLAYRISISHSMDNWSSVSCYSCCSADLRKTEDKNDDEMMSW